MPYDFIKKLILLLSGIVFLQHCLSQPVINSFTPTSGAVGSIVTINGSGFSTNPANNIVYFGPVKAKVNTASSTSLTVTVPAGADYEPITVTTQSLIAYSAKPFIVTFPGAEDVFPPDLFPATKTFHVGKQPRGNREYLGSFFITDLDGDGKTDMVSSTANYSNFIVSVLRNTSNPSNLDFAAKQIIDSAASQAVLSYGDLNGDGKQDLILNYGDSISISVLLNESAPGNIMFGSKININFSENPRSIIVHDIDGDGKVDIVGITGYNYATSHFCILRNTSIGNNLSFAPSINLKTESRQPFKICDLDADGKPDIIIPSFGYYGDSIYIFKNESTPGNIVFGNELKFGTTHGPMDVAIGDLDGDDKPDIAVADNQHGTFSVLRNITSNGLIAFDEPQEFIVGRFPQRIAIGDIDGDNIPDIAVSDNNNLGLTVSLYKNHSEVGLLTFDPNVDFYTSEAPMQLYVADLDGDGKPEIVTIQDFLSICVLLRCAPVEIVKQPLEITVCTGADAQFSFKISDKTTYQWQVNKGNGWIDLANDYTYSGTKGDTLSIKNTNTQMNNYLFRCFVVNECGGVVYSDSAILKITEPSPPSLNITTAATTVCKNQVVTFTAAPTNGGTNPKYQWKKNNVDVGIDSSVYIDSTLNNGDVTSCILTSNAACISSNTATSNAITMNVTSQVTPQVVISSSGNNVCFGTPLFFSAQATNAGSSPSYQWYKNDVKADADTAIYVDSTLNNGDIIKCIITSSLNCGISTVVSNNIVVTIKPLIKPDVSITASENNICPGRSVDFTAATSVDSLVQIFSWNKNGVDVGSNAPVYNDSNITEGDNISCTITLNTTACLTSNTATSNIITMHLAQNLPVPNLGVDKNICAGSSITLDAGKYASYLWQDGSSSEFMKISQPGVYWVNVTDNNTCKGSDTVIIKSIVQPPSNFLTAIDSICSYDELTLSPKGTYSSYLWSTGSSQPSITINEPGKYSLTVINADGCSGSDTITVVQKDCMHGVYIPTAFTPNGDGKNDVFRAMVFGKPVYFNLSVYNRFGEMVFSTTNPSTGWNGLVNAQPQNTGTYIWLCSYKLEGENAVFKKGTVLLMH